MTREEGIERMKALARRQPLRSLADGLFALDSKPERDDAERLTRSVLIDVICERCPEADAAFDAWAESDDLGSAAMVIVAAVRALPRSR